MIERGIIKKVVSDRGFAFIRRDGASDVFFHFSKVVGGSDAFEGMFEDQEVEFELDEKSSDRPRAKMVRTL